MYNEILWQNRIDFISKKLNSSITKIMALGVNA